MRPAQIQKGLQNIFSPIFHADTVYNFIFRSLLMENKLIILLLTLALQPNKGCLNNINKIKSFNIHIFNGQVSA